MRTDEQQTERILRMRDEKSKEKKAMNRKLLAIIPSAACFCMVVAFSAVVLSTGLLRGCSSPSNDKAEINESYSGQIDDKYPSKPDSESVPAGYLYGACSFNGVKYASVKHSIDKAFISERLGESSTYYGTGGDRVDVSCIVYSITGIDTEFAVALKYANANGYYFTFNYDYEPKSLGDIYTDLGFDKYLTAASTDDSGSEPGKGGETHNVTLESLRALFSFGTSEETEYLPEGEGAAVITSENKAVYGEYTLSVTVYSEGYAKVNFCGINKVYKTDTSDFLSAIK